MVFKSFSTTNVWYTHLDLISSNEDNQKQFKTVKKKTTESHVQELGDTSIAQLHVNGFQGRKDSKPVLVPKVEKDSIRSRDLHIGIVKRKLSKSNLRRETMSADEKIELKRLYMNICEPVVQNHLRTPVPAQRFETLAIDLFGPLPESKDGKRWILIIENCTTKWVELFELLNATAKECAITLIEEILLRYGIPRCLISDKGTQFLSAVMQQVCYLLNIHESLIPTYHPQANPVERKNRDLKPRLAILVQDKHDCWSEKLPFIRFALNTAKCETTGQTATFLNFGRELRTPSEVVNDIRVVIQNDNFVPEITPYLKKFAKFSTQIREVVEEQQDSRKFYADKKGKAAPTFYLENMSL
ncbi:pro-Pol polyprotein [Trichonephila clavipes]|nr:pro-Pol polyprotein [Trichonephila clavipes]